MRTNLQVPFAEKDAAKQLGARWDPARKVWFVENKADMSPFAKWLAGGNATAPVKKQASAGITIVGSAYVEPARVCPCLPWEVCELCRATAINN